MERGSRKRSSSARSEKTNPNTTHLPIFTITLIRVMYHIKYYIATVYPSLQDTIPEVVNHCHMLLMMGKKLPETCWADPWRSINLLLLHLVGILYYLRIRWRELAINRKKWKYIILTGQSSQWAVVPMEEEEDYKTKCAVWFGIKYNEWSVWICRANPLDARCSLLPRFPQGIQSTPFILSYRVPSCCVF